MLHRFRKTWEMLGRDILVGQRYERNLRSIRDLSIVLMLAGTVMFVMNIQSRAYSISLTSIAIILAGFLVYRRVKKQDRRGAMFLTISAVVLIFTYDIFFVDNGFAYLWTMLIPLAVSYLFSVRAGILVSAYFWLLFVLAFYTPLKTFLENSYDPIIMVRFPVLFLFHTVFTGVVMVQYHKSTLDQIDYEERLRSAKESAEEAWMTAEKERDSAEKANAAKSEFLTNMSHEIRTPINTVLGMNEMILRESLQTRDRLPKERESIRKAFSDIYGYAGNIESAGNSLLFIINDILDFSKIEAGKLDIVETSYRMSSVLKDVSNLISYKAKNKGLAFHIDVSSEIPDVLYGDQVRVRQVMANLLNNAVKYTEQGSILLTLGIMTRQQVAGFSGQQGPVAPLQQVAEPIARPEPEISARPEPEPSPVEEEKVWLVISVKDTGIGIREEDLGRLFQKFERVDLRKNSTIEGTGLGLAITRSLLDKMGGSIQVESVYGEGSTFTAILPQKVGAEEAGRVGGFACGKEENSTREAEVYRESFRAPDARILIVDDTRMNLTVAAGLLKNTELKIDTAVSGAEAIALAKVISYDLILMDQRMPEMDGTEAMRAIKEQTDGANAHTPFICLTADAVTGARERYITEGFTDYLTKPVDRSLMERMIMQYLPAEKIQSGQEESGSRQKEARSGLVVPAPLREAGIDPDEGLRYCGNDEDLYRSLLMEYAVGAEEKQRVLRKDLEAEDWADYAVRVHALKSTSKMIGAGNLSTIAARLEAAAEAGNAGEILQDHKDLERQYAHAAAGILSILNLKPEKRTEAKEEEILEFLPEEVAILEFLPERVPVC
ncbi:MAG: ATP-binding protein [Eubacteriales bacterium]|nr:ATP-binding protein [Eubacteriales bacterium]